MEGISVILALIALAVGFVAGVFIEYLAANAYISAQNKKLKKLKLEMEALKKKAGSYEVIEIIDHRKEPENYFIPF